MTDRERLATTLGILIAGLFEAEDEAAESERRPRPRHGSGVYQVGDSGLGAPELPPDPGEPARP